MFYTHMVTGLTLFYRKYKILNKCRKYGSNSTPLNLIKTMYNNITITLTLYTVFTQEMASDDFIFPRAKTLLLLCALLP